MTSMLWTARKDWLAMARNETAARRRPFAWASALLLLRAVPRGDVLLLGVLRRGGRHHRTHDRLVRSDPVADHVPLAPVPLDELDRAAALVVAARDLERVHQADRAELLQAL